MVNKSLSCACGGPPARLLAKLKKDYYHAWHGENRGGLHTSSI
jgi:hypothetical protein